MSNRIRWIINHMLHFGGSGMIHDQLPPLLFMAAAAAPSYAAAQMSTQSPSSNYPYTNFDPSTAIMILLLVCAFFFVGFFSIYIRQCVNDTAEAGNSPNSVAARLRRSSRGLDQKVIESFPMFHYSEVKDHKIGKGALECAVCISEFEDDETLRLLPKCDHVFHPECIDAWLASHTTCPVCRANLMPTPDEVTGDTAQGIGNSMNNNSTDEHNSRSELSEVQNENQISINVDEDQNRDPQPSNRQRMAKFQRSHSTGHSLILSGENCDRYRLRLPEEVRKQIMSQRLKRTRSSIALFPMEGSSRSGGEGSSRGRQLGRSDRVGRSDGWVFTMTPPFFSRTCWKVGVDGDITAVVTPKTYMTSVKTSFDCPAVKDDGVEQIPTRLPV